MSDIFEEVEEGLREDRASELWRRFAPFIWGALALVIAAVGVREYMTGEAKKAAQIQSEALEAAQTALTDGDYATAGAAFEALVDEGGKLAPLASHYLARVRLEGNGDQPGAADVLASAGDATGDPFEQLALLKAAYLKADTASLEELETLVGDLTSDETALGALAQELLAAKALAEGDVARARKDFGYLRFAANAPQGVIQRAELALAAMPPAPVAAPETTPIDTDDDKLPAEEAPADTSDAEAEPSKSSQTEPQEANP